MNTTRWQADDRGLVTRCPKCGRRNRLIYERLDSDFRCGGCGVSLGPPSEPVDLPEAASFHHLTNLSALPVLVDFWAPWCGPCKMVAPELAKVAQQCAGRWLLVKVNTEALAEIAARYRVTSIPTLSVFRSGREVQRQAGAMSAPAILRFLAQFE